MKSTHRFQVKASIESIYDKVLSAEGWLSFVPGYQGLESADPDWPDEGSSIMVRYRLLKLIKVTVVEHQPGHRFRTHEESTGGYIDNVDLTFDKEDGTTRLTFVNDVTQRAILLRILFLLMYPLRLITRELILWPRVKKRIKAMVETSSIKNGVGPF